MRRRRRPSCVRQEARQLATLVGERLDAVLLPRSSYEGIEGLLEKLSVRQMERGRSATIVAELLIPVPRRACGRRREYAHLPKIPLEEPPKPNLNGKFAVCKL